MKYEATKLVMPQGHMVTVSGKLIDLFKPDPALITLEDIAHGLSNICRWNGHTKSFYSVAEHSFRVAKLVQPSKRLTALLHDAEEAYWGDVISPLKKLYPAMTEAMVSFRQVIFDKFNVPAIDSEVCKADEDEMYWDYENQIQSFKHVGLHPIKAKQYWLKAVQMHQVGNQINNQVNQHLPL